jgi:hypothetical protein
MWFLLLQSVMPALVAASTSFLAAKDVDGWDKPGQDG